jgi:uncharacterized membrane protein YqgA involved in biofilm formation
VCGTWINVAGIIIGSILGLLWKKQPSAANQQFFKIVLGALAVLCGLKLTWTSLSTGNSFGGMLKQLLVVVVAMMLGRLTGRLLHLQKTSNRIGQYARDKMLHTSPGNPNRFSDGFNVCALLFCAAPLGLVGALTDGLTGYFCPLAVKGVMDGLGAMGFVGLFGFGVLLSAVPVLAFQGTLTLLTARFLLPLLERYDLVHSVNATSGLLIFCVALIVFEIKKIEVTDYLPSLAFAPVLTYWLR